MRLSILGSVALCASSALAQVPPEPAPSFLFEFGTVEQIEEARGIATDANGNIYVADYGRDRIQIFDSRGNFLRGWGVDGTRPGQFRGPSDVAIGDDGNVYVVELINRRIQVFSPQGEPLRLFDYSYAFGPLVSTDVKDRSIFVLDAAHNQVRSFDLFGQPDFGTFNLPDIGYWRAIAATRDRDVYVLNSHYGTVAKYNWHGEKVLEWGSVGTSPGEFVEPNDVATDSDGNVYVADRGNYRLQKFNAQGQLLSVWGSQGGGPGQFRILMCLGTGINGQVYVGQTMPELTPPRVKVFGPTVSVLQSSWTEIKFQYR